MSLSTCVFVWGGGCWYILSLCSGSRCLGVGLEGYEAAPRPVPVNVAPLDKPEAL